MPRRHRLLRAARLSALLIVLAAPVALAQDDGAGTVDASAEERRTPAALRFLAGGFAGLVAHEAGHIGTGLVLGANPGFKRLDYGVIPFFAVTHDPVSRGREFTISVSGFTVQHAVNEWLLSRGSSLRSRPAAFRKGWLTFNLATSALYAVTALGEFGPPERDTRGIAISAGDDGIPEPVVGVFVLVPAVLDGVRYAYDDPAWARWASRGAKIGLLLLAMK